MADIFSSSSLEAVAIHLTGIKGTGMAALAELLHNRGALVSGSDVPEKFYTDEILTRLRIPYREEFSPANIAPEVRLVIYSAAYNPETNPELVAARERGLPLLSYPEALGMLSRLSDSSGVAGVHGKTTTAAMVGSIMINLGLPVSVLVGSAVSTFGDSSTVSLGSRYFVAETCEYRRNFLHFDPARILLTSVEPDHLDYFHDAADIASAFDSYVDLLHPRGALVYCADDEGAAGVARRLEQRRGDVRLVPYGTRASGRFRIEYVAHEAGRTQFRLAGWPDLGFELKIPGHHEVLDAAGAVALSVLLAEDHAAHEVSRGQLEAMARALREFRGSRRRSEIIGEAGGVLVMDDYAHHPTAIRTTLEGLRTFYPGRRIIVDFMSHTYSRTQALLAEFATSFGAADVVILHKIYASAREAGGSVTGRDLYRATSEHHQAVHYFEEIDDALPFCLELVRAGDLFVSMGAGNNWSLSHNLFRALELREVPT